MLPFENKLVCLELRGFQLVGLLEHGAELSWDEHRFNAKNLMHVSGLRVVYNVTNPIGHRVLSVEALCQDCSMPSYAPVEMFKMYRVVTVSYLAEGGDGFEIFPRYGRNRVVAPVDDVQAFEEYVKPRSPVAPVLEERIQILN